MRGIALLVLAACGAIGAAFAQETTTPPAATPAPTVVHMSWDRRASGADFARLYPRAALNHEMPGVAVMCCTIGEDRRPNCETAFEWPQGYGFGEATQRVMREFRVSEDIYPQVREGRLRRTVRWVLPSRQNTPEVEAAFARISQAAQSMCSDGTMEIDPATGDIIVRVP